MVLLTSSQVSVAVSSAVVVSFTTALFLSGYAIQQRTVRNLRAAIKPDTSPHLFLPDRFRDSTTELEDGTIVMLDEYNRPVRLKAGRMSIGKAEEDFNVADAVHNILDNNNSEGQGQTIEITVQETLSEDLQRQEEQKVLAFEELVAVAPQDVMPEIDDGTLPQELPQEPPQPQQEPEAVPAQPQLAPWEVRSEEDPVEEYEAQSSTDSLESTDEDAPKPISRAERRRKIKEDIQKLSQGETPLYYQRRLW